MNGVVKISKYLFIILLALIIYVLTAIPLGMYIYSLKTEKGIDLFKQTGVHSYISCLEQEAYKVRNQKDL
jgi:K+-transporting ATPase A subunit